MRSFAPPPTLFQGRVWTRARLTEVAAAWRRALHGPLRSHDAPVAMVMTNHPQSVALFWALSCFPLPLVVLPPDMKPWRSDPPLPPDTHVVLSPATGDLEAEVRRLGLAVTVLTDVPDGAGAPGDAPPFMTMPGIVMFTSGSTAAPRPVYRRTDAVIAAVRASVDAMALPRGSGVIASMPLARAYGFNHGLVAAVVLDGPLALLRRFHHTAVLKLFASRAYEYWVGTPVMIDVLGRCRLSAARHPAPRVCDVGGRLAADVARRFEERFGVPPRQHYGTTETGTVSVHGVKVDGEATAGGRPELAGHPLRGVEVRIGDDPRTPAPTGTVGRIWLTSRYMMEGYGFPGGLVVPDTVAGWWATPDVGHLDGAGRLTVTGRLDDAVRTDAGQLVNPGHVAAALETYPGIIDVAVVAVTTGAGPVLGVLVESAEPPSLAELRAHLWRSLPAWSQPRVVEVTDRLPRLTNGRIDRRACVARLARALARGAPRVSS